MTPTHSLRKKDAPHKRRAKKNAAGYDYPVHTVGTTPHVKVLCDSSLWSMTSGQTLAQQVLADAESAAAQTAALFGLPIPASTLIIAPLSDASDGTGGAYHYSCQDNVLYCDASFGAASRTLALFVAELTEVLMATQSRGWDCGATNGEGLSRVVAEYVYPGQLDDYNTAAAWLDGTRPNWVDANEGTDQDDQSNGCAVLFLWWLTTLGPTVSAIAQAGGKSLAETYQKLLGKSSAWADFTAAVNAVWPAGTPSGVTTDDPWPAGSPPPGPGPGPGPGPSGGSTLTLSADLPAGQYLILSMPASVVEKRMTLSQWLQLVEQIIALVAGVLGGGSPPSQKK